MFQYALYRSYRYQLRRNLDFPVSGAAFGWWIYYSVVFIPILVTTLRAVQVSSSRFSIHNEFSIGLAGGMWLLALVNVAYFRWVRNERYLSLPRKFESESETVQRM